MRGREVGATCSLASLRGGLFSSIFPTGDYNSRQNMMEICWFAEGLTMRLTKGSVYWNPDIMMEGRIAPVRLNASE